jgi:hypothetical protein
MSKHQRLLTTVTVLLLATGTGRAQQQAQQAQRDPEAIAALQKMGTYLRSLKAMQVEAVTSTEEVLEDGQKVQFSGATNMIARLPDRFRMSVNSDRRSRIYVYDGKQFTVFARRANVYAQMPAPATVALLADMLGEKYDMNLPLEDLFRWGGAQSRDADITSAMYIGPSEVGGVTCGHYAFRQAGLDWQVWIQLGDYPLPRKLVLTTMTDEARPQYTETLTWNLAPSFNDEAFKFVPPAGAAKVPFDLNVK